MSNVLGLLEKTFYPLTLLPLLLFLVFLYKWILGTTATARRSLPPSPPRLPIIGNLHQLTAHPHHALFSLSRKYGEMMLLHFGAQRVLVVSSARSATQIMKTHDLVFANRPTLKVLNRLLYDGKDVSAAPYGAYWRQIKSVCVVQLLSNSRVRSYSRVREEEVSLMVEKVERSVGEEVNLSEVFMMLTNDVVCRVAFGRKYSEKSDFKRLLKELLELLGGFYVGDFVPWLSWVSWLSGLDARVERLVKEFDEFLEGVVQEHENRLDKSKEEGMAKDFVDVLLEVQRDNATGFHVERDTIKAAILDAFAAGTDTTYTVLDWAMSELLRQPRAMRNLQDEVRGIKQGEKSEIKEDNLKNMKYLKAVIKETMRLHPPIPLLVPRESTQDVKLDGYDIPKGTQVITNAFAIHMDPACWEKPDEFLPERFLDSPIDFKGQDFELIPFGAGRRGCPGISFATVSIELALANLVHKFDWVLARGVEADFLDMKETSSVTVQRENPLLVVPSLSS